MTLAVVGTLSTNKQSNKQREKKNTHTLNFSMMSYGITSTVMGSGSILLNRKPQNGFQGSENPPLHCRIRRHKIYQIRTKKMIPARNSNITSALNLITYVYRYMCISSTSGHLMTSSFGPDAELRCVNWFKLLHMPQSLF